LHDARIVAAGDCAQAGIGKSRIDATEVFVVIRVEEFCAQLELDRAGDARFIAAMDHLRFATTTCLPSLAALKQLIEELESLAERQVA